MRLTPLFIITCSFWLGCTDQKQEISELLQQTAGALVVVIDNAGQLNQLINSDEIKSKDNLLNKIQHSIDNATIAEGYFKEAMAIAHSSTDNDMKNLKEVGDRTKMTFAFHNIISPLNMSKKILNEAELPINVNVKNSLSEINKIHVNKLSELIDFIGLQKEKFTKTSAQ